MTRDLVAFARELLIDVTPGPWSDDGTDCEDWDVDYSDGACAWRFVGPEGKTPVAICLSEERSGMTLENLETNANFISAARELVPAMADEIEALRAENAQLKAVLVAIQFYVRGQVDAVEDMRVSPADVMAVAAKLREFKSGKHVADMLHELDGDRE